MKLQRRLIKIRLRLSKDKVGIFLDSSKMDGCNFTESELLALMNEFLTEEEKAQMFKSEAIKSILGENQIETLVGSLGEEIKFSLLHSTEFTSNIEKTSLIGIICSLSEERKLEFLSDKIFIQKVLQLKQYDISYIAESLETDASKDNVIKLYQFRKIDIMSIVRTFSEEGKKHIILSNVYELSEADLEIIASTFSVSTLVEFLEQNEKALKEKGIKSYRIVRYMLTKEKQLEFIGQLEKLNISMENKAQILAMLDEDVKSRIDTSNFNQEYIEALQMDSLYGVIYVDINEPFEKYRNLGDLAAINPLELSSEGKAKLEELFEVCPQIRIIDDLNISSSTIEEYRIGEAWIKEVIDGINEEWTDIQKLAYADHAVGKRISYSPDFETEVWNKDDARPLWKIIASGYGVCNGISQVEQYILGKIGIETEMVSSEKHTFLKIKNIEIPNREGGVSKGDTIVDPTWNLANHKYDAFPENFCKSYEEIRKEDKKDDGTDTKAHEIEGEEENTTIGLDEQSLREIFASIGLANKDGSFKIETFMSVAEIVDLSNLGEVVSVEQKLLGLSKYYTEFANSPKETTKILRSIITYGKKLDFNKCVIDRVYEREDTNKSPVLYVHIDLPESGKHFYVADKGTKSFVRMSEEEFEAKFECYEMDIQKSHGNKPWRGTRKVVSERNVSGVPEK